MLVDGWLVMDHITQDNGAGLGQTMRTINDYERELTQDGGKGGTSPSTQRSLDSLPVDPVLCVCVPQVHLSAAGLPSNLDIQDKIESWNSDMP